MVSAWSSSLCPSRSYLTCIQASQLHPTGCGNSSPYNKRLDCIHYVLGSLSLRRFLRPTSSAPSVDINYNGAAIPQPQNDGKATVQCHKTPSTDKQSPVIYKDPNIPLPRNPKPRHDQTRNNRFRPRRLRRQFRQHVLASLTITSDSRERTGGACFCDFAQVVGLCGCYLISDAGCRW